MGRTLAALCGGPTHFARATDSKHRKGRAWRTRPFGRFKPRRFVRRVDPVHALVWRLAIVLRRILMNPHRPLTHASGAVVAVTLVLPLGEFAARSSALTLKLIR